MAETRTINIDIKNNADKTAKDFDNLNDSLDETAKANEQVNESFDTGATFAKRYGDAIEPLTTRMGEAEDRLYELALAGDTASKEYQELLTKVGEYRKVQIQTDLAVDGAATTMTQKLGGALNGATSGFAATQGAMALFGDENEALEQSLLKVQSALAIQQGVQGLTEAYRELSIGTKLAAAGQYVYTTAVGTSTGAMKLFRLALIGTGIGAIVVGIGLLIANFDKVKKAVTNAISSFDKLGPAMKIILFPITSIVEGFKLMKKGLVAFGIIASDEENQAEKRAENARKRRAALFEQYKEEQQLIQDTIDDTRRASKVKEDAINKEITLRKAAGKGTRELEREKLKLELDTLKKVSAAKIEAYNLEKERGESLFDFQKIFAQAAINDVKKTEFKLQVFDTETNKIKSDNYKQYAAERLSTARKIEDLENSMMEDGIEKELAINEDKFRRLREDAKKNTKLTRKERARLIELFDEQELAQQKVIDQKYIDLEKEKNAKIDEINKKENQERIDKEDALFQLELDLMKDRQMAEIIALSQSYEAKYLLAQDNAELTKQLEAQFLIDQAAIEDQFRLEKLAKDKEASDKQKDLIESERQARLEAIQKGLEYAQQGADAIQQIGDLVFSNKMAKLEEGSKEEEELARKQFKFNKAMQLGGAIIDAGKAITASLASAPIAIGPVPNPAGIASLAFAATTSAVNIAKIASTKFESTGDPADTPTPNIDESAAPNFNVVGDSGINQIAQLQQQPVQAFVVSGEVTTSQALDRNRVQNATL